MGMFVFSNKAMKIGTVGLIVFAVTYILFSDKGYAAPVWTMVDCNAGGSTQDCHVLIDSGEVTIVDTGTVEATKKYFIPYLKREGIREVKNFVVSHPHTNHVGGLINIIQSGITIQNIYINRPVMGHEDFDYKESEFEQMLVQAQKLNAVIKDVKKGDVIKLPTSRIVILESPKILQAEINDYSIIMRWEVRGYSTLFTGDLSQNLGSKLVGNKVFSADFYKAPHHGVKPIAPNEFSDTVNPVLTMVPQPQQLQKHPRGLLFYWWVKQQAKNTGMITCTNGNNGSVSLYFERDHVRLEPEREHAMCHNRTLHFKGRTLTPVGAKPAAIVPVTSLVL